MRERAFAKHFFGDDQRTERCARFYHLACNLGLKTKSTRRGQTNAAAQNDGHVYDRKRLADGRRTCRDRSRRHADFHVICIGYAQPIVFPMRAVRNGRRLDLRTIILQRNAFVKIQRCRCRKISMIYAGLRDYIFVCRICIIVQFVGNAKTAHKTFHRTVLRR